MEIIFKCGSPKPVKFLKFCKTLNEWLIKNIMIHLENNDPFSLQKGKADYKPVCYWSALGQLDVFAMG